MSKLTRNLFVALMGAGLAFCGAANLNLKAPEVVKAADASGTTGQVNWEIDGKTIHIWGSGAMDNYTSFSNTPWKKAGIVGEDAFEKIVIDEGVTNVGAYAFEDCGGIKELSIAKSVTTIGESAFEDVGHSHNNHIEIGTQYFKSVDYKAFYDCNIHGRIVMEDGWTLLGEYAFEESRITSAFIGNPDDSQTWNAYAFGDDDYLLDITFGEGLTWIQEDTCNDCDSLKTVEFGSTMSFVGENAFEDCPSIMQVLARGSKDNITFDDDNEDVEDCDNWWDNWRPDYTDVNGNKVVIEEQSSYQSLTPGASLNVKDQYWIVRATYYVDSTINVTEDSTIVLLDWYGLTVANGFCINVFPDVTLNIVAQTATSENWSQMGYIDVVGAPERCAGIGGSPDGHGSTVKIYGGRIESHGGIGGAGIGTGYGNGASKDNPDMFAHVAIYNGRVFAYGGAYMHGLGGGAGIGAGGGSIFAEVTIKGGYVRAWGGEGASGIGIGRLGTETDTTAVYVNIYGGNIEATGGRRGSGIGCGESKAPVKINIYGGTVKGIGNEAPDIYGGVSGYEYTVGVGTLLSDGSLTIVFGVLAGVFLITSVVFIYLYFRRRKQESK